MAGAQRIVTTQWRVARDGVTEFPTEDAARRHAAKLNADGLQHLGRVRVQFRTVIVSTDHWRDA